MIDNETDQSKKDELYKHQRSVLVKGIFSVLFYATFTTSMVFLNKAVLSN